MTLAVTPLNNPFKFLKDKTAGIPLHYGPVFLSSRPEWRDLTVPMLIDRGEKCPGFDVFGDADTTWSKGLPVLWSG